MTKLKDLVKGFNILLKYKPEINFSIASIYGSVELGPFTDEEIKIISEEELTILKNLGFILTSSFFPGNKYFTLPGG